MNITCSLHALETYIPSQIITNDDLIKIVDTSDQWIKERTGISKRRKVGEDENASTMAIEASKKTLLKAKVAPASITHIIAATCTPDYLSPSIACIVGGALDTGPVMAFDISAACTGFIYGLLLCKTIISAQPDSKILFICTEALTRRLNWKDRSTCVLFGDAAASCLLSANSKDKFCSVVDVICQSDGAQKDLIKIGGGTACVYEEGSVVGEEFFLTMQGRETYKHAVRQMVTVCQNILERNKLSIEDIDLFIPHQANMRIIEAVGARLKIDPEKVFTNLADYGNTSASSIPLAIAEAQISGKIKSGFKVLITAFGAGLTWGAGLLYF